MTDHTPVASSFTMGMAWWVRLPLTVASLALGAGRRNVTSLFDFLQTHANHVGITLDTMQLDSSAWHSWYDLDAAELHAVEVDLT